jgi:hypothetical protein
MDGRICRLQASVALCGGDEATAHSGVVTGAPVARRSDIG